MPLTLQLRRWLRRRVVRPLDHWLAPPPPPHNYPLASRQDARVVRKRLLKGLFKMPKNQ